MRAVDDRRMSQPGGNGATPAAPVEAGRVGEEQAANMEQWQQLMQQMQDASKQAGPGGMQAFFPGHHLPFPLSFGQVERLTAD